MTTKITTFYSTVLSLFILMLPITPLMGQEKKPTIMILPSDNWCTQRYFTTTYDNQGVKVTVPDYQLAFRQDTEIGSVIANVGSLLTDLGYSLKDCEQELKNINIRSEEDNMTMSKYSGASLVESPLDMLKRKTKTDIIIQIGWSINQESSKKSVTFILEAFDAYTSKRIATSTGISKPSKEIIPKLLYTAVESHIKDFDRQLMSYFGDIKENGREIVLTVRCWDSWDSDLESEFEGEELTDCIQEWLNLNTVKGQFNLSDGTESFAQFEQVRIPLFDEKGRALDARGFASKLRKHLADEPYNITSKLMVRGLGEAIIILGEK